MSGRPILADEKTAAKLLCLPPRAFRDLVAQGHLPPPRDLGGFERWDVDDLRRIARGEAMEDGGMTW